MRNLTDVESTLSKLFAKKTGRIKPGLERIRHALSFFSNLNPGHGVGENQSQTQPIRVIIGGTNGKGSTAGMLFHLLSAAGIKCGLYTSPHLCRFSERIQVTDEELLDKNLLKALDTVNAQIPPVLLADMSFFEIVTVLAAFIFRERSCQVEIFEVGLGGTWDSTNVFDFDISALVSIDYDHQSWLGNSLVEIATDKLGIARPNKPLYWSEPCRGDAKSELMDLVLQKQFEVGFFLRDINSGVVQCGETFRFKSSLFKSASLAKAAFKTPQWVAEAPGVMHRNFFLASAMAYDVFQLLESKNGGNEKHVIAQMHNALGRFGSSGVHWPPSLIGRFQPLIVQNKSCSNSMSRDSLRHLLVDVCHNVESVRQFSSTLRQRLNLSASQKIPGIVSIAKDKEIPEMIHELRGVLDPLVVFKMNNERSLQRKDLEPDHRDLVVCHDFESAWKFAVNGFGQELFKNSSDCPWAVCGSFYTVGEVLDYFEAFPPQAQMQPTLHGQFTNVPT